MLIYATQTLYSYQQPAGVALAPKTINISIIIDNCDILQMQQILNQQRVEWTLAQHAIRPEIYCVTQLKQG